MMHLPTYSRVVKILLRFLITLKLRYALQSFSSHNPTKIINLYYNIFTIVEAYKKAMAHPLALSTQFFLNYS